MVFSSLPLNHQFDSHNWDQQGNQPHQLDCVITDQNPNNHLQQQVSSQAGSSHARINSMVDRARIAKVPFPEAALKCPRCDSTNTKFCYFNNYSLTQPRHFCKSCRRYWTRGGALRNVPVGGGFRRNNKRSKSGGGGRSKSTVVVSADNNTTTTSLLSSHSSYSNPSKFLSCGQIQGFTSNLPILSPLQSLGDYSSSNIGLDFGGIQMSTNGGILDPWRTSSSQQFPFLINNRELEQSSNVLYPLLQEGTNQVDAQLRSKPLTELASGSDGISQTIDVKAEENDQNRDKPRNDLGNINRNSMRDNEYTSWGSALLFLVILLLVGLYIFHGARDQIMELGKFWGSKKRYGYN